jgi:hypothetical protein
VTLCHDVTKIVRTRFDTFGIAFVTLLDALHLVTGLDAILRAEACSGRCLVRLSLGPTPEFVIYRLTFAQIQVRWVSSERRSASASQEDETHKELASTAHVASLPIRGGFESTRNNKLRTTAQTSQVV